MRPSYFSYESHRFPQSDPIQCVQGFHNLCTENHAIPDPLLTELGEEQCRKLRDSFPSHSQIDLVTASPLRRTVYTALLSFEPVFKERKDLKVIAIPDAQETSDVPCDTGSHPEVLKKEFEEKNLPVDLSLVNEGWNSKVRRVSSVCGYGSCSAVWAD